jgi:hypothetical protein
MQPHVIAQQQMGENTQLHAGQMDGHINTPNVHEAIIVNPAKAMLNHDERATLYSGQDRLTLQNHNISRVRELQESNDNLQRDILKKEKQMANSSDPLAILADIEHCKIMIARNTGEILKIYTMDEERRKRIAELEEQNAKLRTEMIVTQGKFITNHDMQQRTKYAAEFFMNKASYEKNIAELIELTQL